MDYKDVIYLPYSIDTATDDEIKACVREWRNRQLTASDWTQLADVSLTNKAAWVTYRQELRDITDQGDDPKLWVFPVPPT